MCFDLVSFLFLRLQVSPLLHLCSSFWVFNPASSTGTLLFVTFIVTGLFVSLLFAHNKGAVLAAKSPFLSDFVTAGVNLFKQFPSAVPFNEGLAREQAYAKILGDFQVSKQFDTKQIISLLVAPTFNVGLHFKERKIQVYHIIFILISLPTYHPEDSVPLYFQMERGFGKEIANLQYNLVQMLTTEYIALFEFDQEREA
ncbi:hypothetical protein P5673_008460 [Acropora cervicornis]|uniref:Uncharacterized protein n=1 Tax=Acropora cervicornis TaxID=6130 RepID=A0AAD9QUI2_ACRCE|nr:hypothetical protein P5673_008460 [Acropora cervicornis]